MDGLKTDAAMKKHFAFQLYFLFDAKLTIKFKFNICWEDLA